MIQPMTAPEYIKRAVYACKMRKDFVGVWDEYGLLDGLHGDVKIMVARGYYNMSCYLVDKEPNTMNALGFDMSVTLLPIIRRVVSKTEVELKNPKSFLEFCMDFVRERVDHYEHITKVANFDMEALICADISDMAIKIIKG